MVIDAKINEQNNEIIINADTENASHIISISIDTQKSFICWSEPSPYACVYECNASHVEHTFDLNDPTSVNGILRTADVKKDMFFITFRLDSGVEYNEILYDENLLYNKVFNRLNSEILSKGNCDLNCNAGTSILLLEGFELATNPRDKIYYWNLLNTGTDNVTGINCGCNG